MGEQTKATDTNGVSQAGGGEGRADSNGALKRYRRLGAVYEIVVVAALPLCVLTLGSGAPWWLAAVTIAGVLAVAAASYREALRFAGEHARELTLVERKRAAEAAEREKALKARESKTMYRVTEGRLRTLREVGVPEVVLDALKLIEHGPMKKDDLLRKLALDPKTDLGWERTNEFAERILKYTKHEAESGGGEGAAPEGADAKADAKPEGTRGAGSEVVATAGSVHASAGVGV